MTRRFPSPTKLVVGCLLLDPALADTGTPEEPIYHVGDPEERPVALRSSLPYAWVLPGGGQRDDITDTAFVDVRYYTGPDQDGMALAENACDLYVRPRTVVPGVGVIDRVRISIRPQAVPSGTTNVSCHLVQFQVSARRTGG